MNDLNDDFNIDKMSEILFTFHKAISTFKQANSLLSNDSLNEIRKVEVHALLLATRIDVTICFKNIKLGINKYEGCFYLNIAFMKMYEIMESLLKIITKKENPLYYNPHQESKAEILKIVNRWKKLYGDWARAKRNYSTAHYEPDFFRYINTGYMEINPAKNQECFLSFYKAMEQILESMNKYDPMDSKYVQMDIEKYRKRDNTIV